MFSSYSVLEKRCFSLIRNMPRSALENRFQPIEIEADRVTYFVLVFSTTGSLMIVGCNDTARPLCTAGTRC